MAKVTQGEPLMRIHARSKNDVDAVLNQARKAVVIADVRPKKSPLILAKIGGKNGSKA